MLPSAPNLPLQPHELNWAPEICRGMAALMVVLAHYYHFFSAEGGYLRYMFTGVDFFFVLSGFVFAPYFVEQRRLDLSSFFVRRLFRLYPLYLLALAGYGFARFGMPDLSSILAKHVFMLHTLENRQIAFALNPAFWSLPPEVEFYLALPLLAWACRRRGGLAALCVLSIAMWSLAIHLLPAMGHAQAGLIVSVHLPGLLIEFLSGVLAYAALRRGSLPLAGAIAILAAGLLLQALWGSYVSQLLMAGGDALLKANPITAGTVGPVSAVGYALIIAGLTAIGMKVRIPQALVRASLWIGGASYGVYLFHSLPPLLLAPHIANRPLLGAVCALMTLATAVLLHRWYEAPLRAFGRSLGARIARRGGAPAAEARRAAS